MTTGVEAGQAPPPKHACRFLRQLPDTAHVALCTQCGAEYRLALVHELAHVCLIDLEAGGACMRCSSVFSATGVQSA